MEPNATEKGLGTETKKAINCFKFKNILKRAGKGWLWTKNKRPKKQRFGTEVALERRRRLGVPPRWPWAWECSADRPTHTCVGNHGAWVGQEWWRMSRGSPCIDRSGGNARKRACVRACRPVCVSGNQVVRLTVTDANTVHLSL